MCYVLKVACGSDRKIQSLQTSLSGSFSLSLSRPSRPSHPCSSHHQTLYHTPTHTHTHTRARHLTTHTHLLPPLLLILVHHIITYTARLSTTASYTFSPHTSFLTFHLTTPSPMWCSYTIEICKTYHVGLSGPFINFWHLEPYKPCHCQLCLRHRAPFPLFDGEVDHGPHRLFARWKKPLVVSWSAGCAAVVLCGCLTVNGNKSPLWLLCDWTSLCWRETLQQDTIAGHSLRDVKNCADFVKNEMSKFRASRNRRSEIYCNSQ